MSQNDKSILRRIVELEAGSVPGFSGAYGDLTGIPSTFTPSAHGHVIADIAGLQAALDLKLEAGLSLTIPDINGLQLALDGKADSTHAHVIADVTGLQNALNLKLDIDAHERVQFFASRAAAEAATVISAVKMIAVYHDDQLFMYVDAPGATALVTNGGRTWDPVGPPSVGHYGAVNDGGTDNGPFFNAALLRHREVLINATPDKPANSGFGGYRTRTTILMQPNTRLYGMGSEQSWIRSQNGLGDAPVIAYPNWNGADTDPGIDDCVFDGFQVRDTANPDRNTQWSVDMSNGRNSQWRDVKVIGVADPADAAKNHGIKVGRVENSTYANNLSWVHTFNECEMIGAKIFINTSDCAVNDTKCYSFGKEYSIRIGGSQVDVNNTLLAGGATYGGIYIQGDSSFLPGERIRHVTSKGCFMDGGSVNNRVGLRYVYAPASQPIEQCQFHAMDGFNAGREAIRLEDANRCSLISIQGRDNDQYDNGLADIYVRGEDNTIVACKFERTSTCFKSGTFGVVEPRVNFGSWLDNVDTGDGVEIGNRGTGAGYGTSNPFGDQIAEFLFAFDRSLIVGGKRLFDRNGCLMLISRTNAEILDRTSDINTQQKRENQVVRNSTDGKVYASTGSGPTDSWVSFDGATTLTPS